MMENHLRTSRFRKNTRLEAALTQLNGLLAASEASHLAALAGSRERNWPLILVVGAPRSGTTLLMQWLASLGSIAYPSNFLSRFYAAPAVGAMIQRVLFDAELDFNGEFAELASHIAFESDLGKTRGTLSPNEFWYFWRRFFTFGETSQLQPADLSTVDTAMLRQELQALAGVFGKPLALKAMLLNWHVDFLAQVLPNLLVLNVERDPLFNMQSLLLARDAYFGDRSLWYSFKPPEFAELSRLTPFEQVAGQVHLTREVLARQRQNIAAVQWLDVQYENFCVQPGQVYRQLREKLQQLGVELAADMPGESSFVVENRVKLQANEWEALQRAHAAYVK